jgi:hypothetical protein
MDATNSGWLSDNDDDAPSDEALPNGMSQRRTKQQQPFGKVQDDGDDEARPFSADFNPAECWPWSSAGSLQFLDRIGDTGASDDEDEQHASHQSSGAADARVAYPQHQAWAVVASAAVFIAESEADPDAAAMWGLAAVCATVVASTEPGDTQLYREAVDAIAATCGRWRRPAGLLRCQTRPQIRCF